MSRLQKFEAMGNNCRIRGMSVHQAQGVLDKYAMRIQESEFFWKAFFNGSSTETVNVTELEEVFL